MKKILLHVRISGLLLQEPNRFRWIMEFYPYFYIWLYILGERMTSEQIKGIARSLGQKKKTRQLRRLQLVGFDFAKGNNLHPIWIAIFQCRADKSFFEAFLGKMITPKVRTASSSHCPLATVAAIRPITSSPFLAFDLRMRLSFLGSM